MADGTPTMAIIQDVPDSAADGNSIITMPTGNNKYSLDFYMYTFKAQPCPLKYSHDWGECPYAHTKEKGRRRDPRMCKYSSWPCPDAVKGENCPRGEDCPYAHSLYEYWLHPTRFRTQMCKKGTACNRSLCFFAHCSSELRFPAEQPPTTCPPLPGSSVPPPTYTVLPYSMSSLRPGQINMGSLPPMPTDLGVGQQAPLSGSGMFVIHDSDLNTWQDTSSGPASASDLATNITSLAYVPAPQQQHQQQPGCSPPQLTDSFQPLMGGSSTSQQQLQQQLQQLAAAGYELVALPGGQVATLEVGSPMSAPRAAPAQADSAMLAALLGNSSLSEPANAFAPADMLAGLHRHKSGPQTLLGSALNKLQGGNGPMVSGGYGQLPQGIMSLDVPGPSMAYHQSLADANTPTASAAAHMNRVWQQPTLRRGMAQPPPPPGRSGHHHLDTRGRMLHQLQPGLMAALTPTMNLQEVHLYNDLQPSPRVAAGHQHSSLPTNLVPINSGSMVSGSSALSESSAMYTAPGGLIQKEPSPHQECEVASWW